MKTKLFFFALMAGLCLMAGCSKENKDNNVTPQRDNDVYFCSDMSGCYNTPSGTTGSAKYVTLTFATYGVSFNGTKPIGDGKIVSVSFFTSKLEASTLFPAVGEYIVSDKKKAGNIYNADIVTIRDGVAQSPISVESGRMVISGNANECTIDMAFGNQGSYLYSGPISLIDRRSSTDPDPDPDPDDKSQKVSFLSDLSEYFGAPGDYDGLNAHGLLYCFATSGVTYTSSGDLNGNGKLIYVIFFSSSVNSSTFFPLTGSYYVSDNYGTAWDIYGGSGDFNGSMYGSWVYTVSNGSIVSGTTITKGSMSISGNASKATVTIDLKEGFTYTYNGPISVSDGRPDPDDAYVYEPTTRTTLNLSSSNATITDYMSGFGFAFLDFTATNGMYGGIYLNVSNNLYRNYAVGTGPNDYSEGTVLYSAGSDEDGLYYSLFCSLDNTGYVITENPVYFVTGGYITVTSTGSNKFSAFGSFTTYFGSTINVNVSGNVVQGSQNIRSRSNVVDKSVKKGLFSVKAGRKR